MRMRTVASVTCALALLLPHATHAQDDARLARVQASVSAATYANIAATVRAAHEAGLPTEPLIAKALEGVAKRVAEARIGIAVQELATRLGRARAVLDAAAAAGGGANPAGQANASSTTAANAAADAAANAADVTAVADALQRGVPEDAIRSLAQGDGRASVALSVHALADLLGQGVPLAIGIEVIGAWRGHGADAARLHEIPAAVERLVRQGVLPARAGAAVAGGLRLGRRPGSITPADVPRIIGGGR